MGCEPELLKKAAKPAATRKLDLPKGVPPLTSLYMYIAGSCNLACRHCWISPTYEPDNSKGQFLKLAYIKKAVREAKPLGLQSVKLTGGEPMLHPHIREIIDYLESQNINMIMETNGTLIDDKIAKFLKSKPHFNFISVSIDGAKAKTHDKLRGVKGSFKQATAGIKSLVKVGFHPQIICTLHKGNVAELEDVIKLAESLGCGSVKFNHVQHMGRGDNFAEKNSFTIKELIKLFQKIECKILPKSKTNIYFDIPIAFYSMRKMLTDSQQRCTIKNIIGLLATGDFALCGIGYLIPELIYGHVGRDDLNEVWNKSQGLINLREQIPSKLEGICALCIHRDWCQGACAANNFHASGRLNAPYFFCDNASQLGLFPKSRIKMSDS